MRDLLYIALAFTVAGFGVGHWAGSVPVASSLIVLGWLPILFIALLKFGWKADEFFGVEHGYGWVSHDADD